MPIEWGDEWMRATGGSLRGDALEFLTEVAVHAPGSTVLWRQPRRGFERCAVEGLPQAPRLVAYFRAEAQRPGLLLAFGWPLDQTPPSSALGCGWPTSWSCWMRPAGDCHGRGRRRCPRVGAAGDRRWLRYAARSAA